MKSESKKRRRDSSSFSDKLVSPSCAAITHALTHRAVKLMREIYGSHHVEWSHDTQNKIVVTVDSSVATVDTDTLVSVPPCVVFVSHLSLVSGMF